MGVSKMNLKYLGKKPPVCVFCPKNEQPCASSESAEHYRGALKEAAEVIDGWKFTNGTIETLRELLLVSAGEPE